MTFRRRLPAVALIASGLLLTGCAALPDTPGPLPSDWIPSPAASPVAQTGAISPDGFSLAQRMTVRVRNVGCGFRLSTGTAFVYDESTLITNGHVITDSREIQLSTYNGTSINATAVASTTVADIAIVRIEDSNLTDHATLAQEDPEEGDVVTIIGYPLGGELTTVSGVVLGATSDPLNSSVGRVLVTSAEVEPGSSGSPVLNESGQVVAEKERTVWYRSLRRPWEEL